MKIATWNVNSITQRLPHVLRWLEKNGADVLLLQELKCTEEKFPRDELEKAGYDCAVFGQKSWNGVAILSRHGVADVEKGLPGDDSDEQARYIEATVGGVRVASVYLPNGNPAGGAKYAYKLAWCDRLLRHARNLLASEAPVVLGGDYNIIPEPRDCHDPGLWSDDALFLLDSRRKWRALVNLGYTDAFRAFSDRDGQYTYWDYQGGAWARGHGIRIDHFLLSPQAADRAKSCVIDAEPRGMEKASDHTPVVLEIA